MGTFVGMCHRSQFAMSYGQKFCIYRYGIIILPMSVNSGPCWERVRYFVSPSSQWFQSEQNGSVLAHSQIIGKQAQFGTTKILN